MAAAAASTVEEPFFWLPSDFLADDDFLFMDDATKHGNNNPVSPHSAFPYRFETQACQHRLEKLWMMSASPQSPLPGYWAGRSSGPSSNGSPNAVVTAPFGSTTRNDDGVGDLIYRAAGELAKLRLSHGGEGFGLGLGLGPGPGPVKDNGLTGPTGSLLPQYYPEAETRPSAFPHSHLLKQQCGRAGQGGWAAQQDVARRSLAGEGGGAAAARRPRAGTGVFLPRGYYGNNESKAYSSDAHRKQQPGSSNALSPVLNHTKSFNYLNDSARTQPNIAPSKPQFQSQMEMDSFVDYDSLMARRQAIVLQKRRSLLLASLVEGHDLYLPHASRLEGHDIYLPREWSY